MSVEFNEGPVLASRAESVRYSFPTRLVLKTGLVKTPESAAVVLFILSILALLSTYALFGRALSGPPAATPQQLLFEQY